MFSIVDGAIAIVRKPKGVYIQANCYRYNGYLWVKAAGGFIRVGQKFGDYWTTSHPDYKVIAFDGVEPNA